MGVAAHVAQTGKCEGFNFGRKSAPLFLLKVLGWWQTRRFSRKGVVVRCGAGVWKKKGVPGRFSILGCQGWGPARWPLGHLGTDCVGRVRWQARWVRSGPRGAWVVGPNQVLVTCVQKGSWDRLERSGDRFRLFIESVQNGGSGCIRDRLPTVWDGRESIANIGVFVGGRSRCRILG